MTKLLKFAVLLLLPLVVVYPIFGLIFWNWDMQSWGAGTRFAYLEISFLVGMVTAATWIYV